MRIAIPNKGPLHKPAVEVLRRAGIEPKRKSDRELYANTPSQEVTILYARESDIPEYLAGGNCDIGLTTQVHARKLQTNLFSLIEMGFGREQVVLAGLQESSLHSIEDLEGKTIATEYPIIAQNYFEEKGVDIDILEVSGAAELTPKVEMSEAIVGTTKKWGEYEIKKLRIIETIFESTACLFVTEQQNIDPAIERVATAIQAATNANENRYVMMNVPSDKVEEIKKILHGFEGPTVMDIAGRDAMAVHAVIDENDSFDLIRELQRNGATDILITRVNQFIS